MASVPGDTESEIDGVLIRSGQEKNTTFVYNQAAQCAQSHPMVTESTNLEARSKPARLRRG